MRVIRRYWLDAVALLAIAIVFLIPFAFIVLTGVAVVALGWHYPTDIVGGFALALFSIWLSRWQSARLLPRFLGA